MNSRRLPHLILPPFSQVTTESSGVCMGLSRASEGPGLRPWWRVKVALKLSLPRITAAGPSPPPSHVEVSPEEPLGIEASERSLMASGLSSIAVEGR